MVGERERQRWKIELIASENYAFAAVLEAQGSWLTNKYAEGQPGRRYYGGCEYVDEVELLAEERALALFPGAEHVNVQPHSGAQANMAAYLSVLNPGVGDRVLGMNLAHGGHLTHGSPVNFSGKWFEIHAYGVREDDARIDYDALEKQAREVRPKMIVAGASAYPRIIDFERMGKIAKSVDALLMVDMAHIAGLVAADKHPSPFPHADLVTTTTHKTLRGPRGGLVFSRADLGKQVDKTVFPGLQGGPLMHVIAAKAVALKLAASDEFKIDIEHTIQNAQQLATTLAENGVKVVSGGTDNHLMLVDVTPLGVTGKEAEAILDEVGITVNKNAIPFDPLPPNTSSGIRVGTPATTTRGFGEAEMRGSRSAHRERDQRPRGRVVEADAPRPRPRHLCALPGSRPARGVSQAAFSALPAILVALVAAAILSFVLTPLTIRFADRLGAIDVPNDKRRVHARPIPRTGGIAVAAAFVIVGALGLAINNVFHFVSATQCGAHPGGHCAVRRRESRCALRLPGRSAAAPGALAVCVPVRTRRHRTRVRHHASIGSPTRSATRHFCLGDVAAAAATDSVDRGHDQ